MAMASRGTRASLNSAGSGIRVNLRGFGNVTPLCSATLLALARLGGRILHLSGGLPVKDSPAAFLCLKIVAYSICTLNAVRSLAT